MTTTADRDHPSVRREPRVPAGDVDWIARLPKAELHLHLSGSLRPTTALRLARERGRYDELDDAALLARLRAPDRCADQAELLDAFTLPTVLLQDAESLQTAAAELVEDVAAEGTRYVEIRLGPANHVRGGMAASAVIEAAAAGVAEARVRLASPPTVRLIVLAMRTDPVTTNVEVARVAGAARSLGVVGFDLAGLEHAAPSVAAHRAAFDVARDAGLGISVHAGEWGGAAQVREALWADPARIAHGGPAADDATLLAALRDRNVTLDVCLTSNAQAGLVPTISDHPLPRLVQAGVATTLSTDDRTVSATTLCRELEIAMDTFSLGRDEILALTRQALSAAFLHDEEHERASLIADLAAFDASERAAGSRSLVPPQGEDRHGAT